MKKKKNNIRLYIVATIAMILYIFSPVLTVANCIGVRKPSDEVVIVDSTLMKSHKWDEAFFDIECVDSLQHEGDYYWFIYDSPDQFETVLCVSTNRDTFIELNRLMNKLKSHKYSYYIYPKNYIERFHLYYGQCEETVLIFE